MCWFFRWAAMSFVFLLCGSVALADMKGDLLAKGKESCDREDYTVAVKVFTEVVLMDPTCAEGYYGRGVAYANRGDDAAAIRDFSEAIRLNPRKARAYLNRGIGYLQEGQTQKAISDFTEVIRLDPTEETAYCNRSALYLAQKEYDLAIADAGEAIRLAPTDACGYLNRSAAWGSKEDYPRAIADATRAIELDPKSATAYTNRGRAYMCIGKLDEAIPDLRRAIILDPQCAKCHHYLAGVYFAKGEWDEALADVNEAVRLSPKWADAYWRRGTIHASKKDIGRAIQDFTTGISLAPKNAMIHLSRGKCYAGRQEYEKALADYNMAITLNPNSACFHEIRGVLWIERGAYDRGIADIGRAIRMNPSDLAATFENWPKSPITAAALEHGKEQVRQMLQDRPAMKKYEEAAAVLYEWAARKFAGEDLGKKIFWDASEPPAVASSINVCPTDHLGVIKISEKCDAGMGAYEGNAFEEFWCRAVFELYNICGTAEFLRLERKVAEDGLSKREFVRGMIECESRAAEKTRTFYVCVFLPWAKEHHVFTHPNAWFVACRTAANDNLLLAQVTGKGWYWRYYARQYDRIILQSLAEKGEYQKALDLAANMRKEAETVEERAAISIYTGNCLVHLDKPLQAISAFSEAIVLDPKDANAYLGRAAGYAMLHDTDQALADASEAIRLEPLSSEAYSYRAQIYEALGGKERAKSDLAMAKQLSELSGEDGADSTKDSPKSSSGTPLPFLDNGRTRADQALSGAPPSATETMSAKEKVQTEKK